MPELAINGGPKACKTPWPSRGLFTEREKKAVDALFDTAIAKRTAFGYNGPEEEAYCQEFAQAMGGGYADAVNSGTNAVYVAVRALEVEPFTEVIVPPMTDAGGIMPVPLCNLIPVPADSMPGSYNMGPDEIEARITPQTSAIIVAHIGGVPAPMGPIMEIAKARGLKVVEDCAQAHGAKYRGRFLGAWGHVGAFSTMFGKHHATGGQGGVVYTRDKDLFQKIRWYSDRGKPFGLPAGTGNVVAALNCNLNDLSACIGRVQLKRLPGMVAARRKSALWLAEQCKTLKSVRVIADPPHGETSFWFIFLRLDLDKIRVDKAAFVKALAAEGVPAEATYSGPVTDSPWYKERAVFGKTGYPWACPLYKGDPKKEYALPNFLASMNTIFRINHHEKVGVAKMREVFAALRKVEAAYLK